VVSWAETNITLDPNKTLRTGKEHAAMKRKKQKKKHISTETI
jgi:hypothetical protein